WEPLGSAWLKLGARRRREKSEAGGARAIESVTAETRSDVRLIPRRMLRFGGADWRIVSGEVVGGRAILTLERMR
ncbi:MAG: phage head-tail adapter protein, partial [Phenylobacterium sp.]|nr:phage head-tail adapter protein [Phenylobacterium sp.]